MDKHSSNPCCSRVNCIPQRIESRVSKTYLYTHLHGINQNSQKVEETQISVGKGMNKQNLVYMHNGTVFSLKKEGNPDTCYNMDEP